MNRGTNVGVRLYRLVMVATTRGHIEQLPSGSFRVHVYAGTDPAADKRRRLTLKASASRAASLHALP
jgi:hypothetical protein